MLRCLSALVPFALAADVGSSDTGRTSVRKALTQMTLTNMLSARAKQATPNISNRDTGARAKQAALNVSKRDVAKTGQTEHEVRHAIKIVFQQNRNQDISMFHSLFRDFVAARSSALHGNTLL